MRKGLKLKVCVSPLLLLSILFCGCDTAKQTTHLEQIKKRGVLRVASLEHTRFFHEQHGYIQSFDYELAANFANTLGVELLFESLPSIQHMIEKLERNQVDLATAIHITPMRKSQLRFGPSYMSIMPTIIHHQDKNPPSPDIPNIIVYVGNDSHYRDLLHTNAEFAPKIKWRMQHVHTTTELLQKVQQGELDYVLINDSLLAHQQQQYPELKKTEIGIQPHPIAWATNYNQDPSLWARVVEFFGQSHFNGTLTSLNQKYFDYSESFNYPGLQTFLYKVKTKLPKYKSLFKRYAGELDWRMLAAISYQESHWNPYARSPTGVRGLMMLTMPTAKSLGIKNRIDPEQSVKGGAKFLQQLLNRLPVSIPEKERIWFALAAYNMGYGHMLDARKITRLRGQNPNLWIHVSNNLHLLHQRKWYQKTQYGFARGVQARSYVSNVRLFYQSLQRLHTHELTN